MKINPVILYLRNSDIEARANALLDRYSRELAPIVAPPVPVEKIADLLLAFNLSWEPIQDSEDEPVLAFIDATQHSIKLNDRRRAAHFDKYPGLYEYTLGHEVGHADLHVLKAGLEQTELKDWQARQTGMLASSQGIEQNWQPAAHYLCRKGESSNKDRREYQADVYASYLLLPEQLLLPAAKQTNLLNWSSLYNLRDLFAVSISALTNRLNKLGLLYVAPDGTLHRSEAEANGQLHLFQG